MLRTQLMLRMFWAGAGAGSGAALGRAGLGWVTVINTCYNLATQVNPQITQIKVEQNNIKYVNEF